MTPRRRIEPLAPPPGAFEDALRRSRYRRHRRSAAGLTLVVVFLAGVAGGLAIDAPRQLVEAAAQLTDQRPDSGTTSAAPDSTESGEVKTKGKASRGTKQRTKSPSATAESSTSRAARGRVLRGVAVGPAGQPAAGLYVYVGLRGSDTFVPTRNAAALTGADGSFSVPCPRTPVLLAPWPIFGQAKSKARAASWQATFVGGATSAAVASAPPCGSGVVRTVIPAGSSVTGTVSMPLPCDDAHNDLLVWLHGDRRSPVRIQDLSDGDVFRVGGLPPGQHTLATNDLRTPVTVGGAEISTADVSLLCAGPSITPDPSESPAPSPTPTDSKSPSGPSSPSPSTAAASPSPTGSDG